MDAFEKLEVWKRSCRLCVDLYKALNGCKDFGFKDQIARSALSVPSNIAEGYERNSVNEYARFLKIAKGSCGELRTELYIAKETGLLDQESVNAFITEALELSKNDPWPDPKTGSSRLENYFLYLVTCILYLLSMGDRLTVGQQTLTLFI